APKDCVAGHLIRRCCDKITPVAEHRGGFFGGVDRQGAIDLRAERMQLKLERGRDTEVAATATHRPEEVRMLSDARLPHRSISSDDLDREQVVAGQPPFAAQEAHAADQGETSYAGGRCLSARSREPVELRLMIQISPVGARLNTG